MASKPHFDVHVEDATAENFAPFGQFISGEACESAGLTIPFYSHVEEGKNLPFHYHGKATMRTARIHPSANKELAWIERHLRLSQVFIPLGNKSCVLTVAPPCEGDRPDPATIRAVRVRPGVAVILGLGVWHDFPRAVEGPVTVLTMNSEEVVDALAKMDGPGEMDSGDVYKISIPDTLGCTVDVHMPPDAAVPPAAPAAAAGTGAPGK